jgi:hypothetical protein
MHLSFGLVASRLLVAESNHVGYFESKSGSVVWLAYVPYSLGVAHVRSNVQKNVINRRLNEFKR